jgi:hypothetical protein
MSGWPHAFAKLLCDAQSTVLKSTRAFFGPFCQPFLKQENFSLDSCLPSHAANREANDVVAYVISENVTWLGAG